MTEYKTEWLKNPTRVEKYVYLDTSVFYQSAFNVTDSHLGALIKNLDDLGKIIIWNDVLREEIRSALIKKVTDLRVQFDKFEKFFRNTAALTNLTRAINGEFVDEKMHYLDKAVFGNRSLKLDIQKIGVNRILEDYFANRPPFDGGKKKAEFPDAIALSVLNDWAEDKRQSVIVVSGDSDFERFCQDKVRLEFVKDIKVLATQLLANKEETDWIHGSLCDPDVGLTEWIQDAVGDHPAEVWDVDGEVMTSKLEDYSIERIFVWQKRQVESGQIIYNLSFDSELDIYFEYLFSGYEAEWPGQDLRDIRPNTIEQWGNRKIIGQFDLEVRVTLDDNEIEIEALEITSPETFTVNAEHRF